MRTEQATSVGVHIGRDAIRLVGVAPKSRGAPRIVGYSAVPIDPGIPPASEQFAVLLRTSLADFCGKSRKSKLWASVSSAGVNARSIRIPALRQGQVYNAAYWTFKKESPFDDAEVLFDLTLEGETVEEDSRKLIATAYTVPRCDLEWLRGLFAGIGYPLAGLTLPLFTNRSLSAFGWTPTAQDPSVFLYVGDDYSRISVLAQGSVVLTRGVKSGMAPLTESIMNDCSESVTVEQARTILLSLDPDAPSLTKSGLNFRLKEAEILDIVTPALQRLVRQIERTLSYHATATRGSRLTEIFMTGAIAPCDPLVRYISQHSGVTVHVLNPFEHGETAPGLDVPPTADAVLFTEAAGLALCGEAAAPNLLQPFCERDKRRRAALLNRAILALFMLLLGCSLGARHWLSTVAARKEAILAGLHVELAQHKPEVEQPTLERLMQQAIIQQQRLRHLGRKQLGMAALHEVSRLTPMNVRLTAVDLDLGPPVHSAVGPPQPAADTGASAKPAVRTVRISGFIYGERQGLNSHLARYIIRLGNSALFAQPGVVESRLESFIDATVLRFTLRLVVSAGGDGSEEQRR